MTRRRILGKIMAIIGLILYGVNATAESEPHWTCWDGGGSLRDDCWSEPGNWLGSVPSASDEVRFSNQSRE